MEEKRGPIEKGEKGWPINPFGVIALIVFTLIVIFLVVKPLLRQKTVTITPEQTNSPGGKIAAPQAGDIVRTSTLPVELKVDSPENVEKVQFWVKTYSDGKWQMIGEVTSNPYKFDWQIPDSYKNKAVAITTHIYKKNGEITKDPGGWREGIIILSPQL